MLREPVPALVAEAAVIPAFVPAVCELMPLPVLPTVVAPAPAPGEPVCPDVLPCELPWLPWEDALAAVVVPAVVDIEPTVATAVPPVKLAVAELPCALPSWVPVPAVVPDPAAPQATSTTVRTAASGSDQPPPTDPTPCSPWAFRRAKSLTSGD